MSRQSNDNGRGYEYACLNVLKKEISKYKNCIIEKNSSYYAAENAWNNLNSFQQANYIDSAESIVGTIFDLEPLIIEERNNTLKLKMQPDLKGEVGDVRDIVMLMSDLNWEIGLSIKHNSFAVKHSRLAKTLDFSGKWFNQPCTGTYWDCISKIFEYLEHQKREGKMWSELPAKDNDVYMPLLKAFMEEIIRQNNSNADVPKKMVEYLLGEFDFYKIISIDNKKTTLIQAFNLHGTLNKSSALKKPIIEISIIDLPTRIVSLDFKPNSKNTIELYMDNGWQFSFRIHNASTYVETSLKFDIQIIGMPAEITTISCKWK